MPRGDKSSYTHKQKREAEHIEEGYEKRGVPVKEAERRAWATVNKQADVSEVGPPQTAHRLKDLALRRRPLLRGALEGAERGTASLTRARSVAPCDHGNGPLEFHVWLLWWPFDRPPNHQWS